MNPEVSANLRNTLAELYPDEPSMRRITADSGIDLSRVVLNSNATNNWHFILTEAVRSDRVDALLGRVESEYGSHNEFQKVCDTYRRSAGLTGLTNLNSHHGRSDDQGQFVSNKDTISAIRNQFDDEPNHEAKSALHGLVESLLAAFLSIVATILIRISVDGKLLSEDIYIASGIFIPLVIISIYRYRKPNSVTRLRNTRTPSWPQPFRDGSLISRLALIVLPILVVPLVFYLLTGRNVLFTVLIFPETKLPTFDGTNMVFDVEEGKILPDASLHLRLSAIRFEYSDDQAQNPIDLKPYTQSITAFPVERGNEGWKIRLENLVEEGLLEEKSIISVPHKIQVVVNRLRRSNNLILIYVFTDEVYVQQPTYQLLPLKQTRVFRDIYIGQPGVINFIDVNDYSITQEDSPNILSLGVGPLAALMAVEFEDGEPILRSDVIFVKRKGILNPDDVWFNDSQMPKPFISMPFSFDGERKVAFQSPEPVSSVNDIIISRLDGTGVINIAPSFFTDSDEVICGWGNQGSNQNSLYFLSSKEGGNNKVPYKISIKDGVLSKPVRLSLIPPLCEQSK